MGPEVRIMRQVKTNKCKAGFVGFLRHITIE